MNLNFHLNPKIDMEKIKDSMQLDSNQTIAHLKVDDWDITLEVKGDVRVQWNPDPKGDPGDGKVYRHASDFPDELKKLFEQGYYPDGVPNLYVDDNNWFEVFVEKNGRFVDSDVVDAEESSPADLFSMLYDTYLIYKKQEEES